MERGCKGKYAYFRERAKGNFSCILVRTALSCCGSVSLVPLEDVFIIAGLHLSLFNDLVLFLLADRLKMKYKNEIEEVRDGQLNSFNSYREETFFKLRVTENSDVLT